MKKICYLLNINIDGAGYREGKSAFPFFDLTEKMQKKAYKILEQYTRIIEGEQWPHGDHSIFIQNGRSAIAVSSKWFIDNINGQDITHTPKDNIGIVDCTKLVEIAEAIALLIKKL